MTGDEAGYRERERAEHVAILHHRRPPEEVRVHPVRERVRGGVDPPRRAHAELHRVCSTLRRDVDDHETAATEPAHPRLHRAEREARRHRGIDRVAARFEHPGADLRREMVLAGDDSAGGANLRLRMDQLSYAGWTAGGVMVISRWGGRDGIGSAPGRGSASAACREGSLCARGRRRIGLEKRNPARGRRATSGAVSGPLPPRPAHHGFDSGPVQTVQCRREAPELRGTRMPGRREGPETRKVPECGRERNALRARR